MANSPQRFPFLCTEGFQQGSVQVPVSVSPTGEWLDDSEGSSVLKERKAFVCLGVSSPVAHVYRGRSVLLWRVFLEVPSSLGRAFCRLDMAAVFFRSMIA